MVGRSFWSAEPGEYCFSGEDTFEQNPEERGLPGEGTTSTESPKRGSKEVVCLKSSKQGEVVTKNLTSPPKSAICLLLWGGSY